MEGGELTSARYVLAKAGVELPEALNQAGVEYLLMCVRAEGVCLVSSCLPNLAQLPLCQLVPTLPAVYAKIG